ncbi:hypothetical protein B0H13DRAFT_1862132 [Mycena leptocephala]|nr:hypothetical protein B0H13DRAFT_1862132 [Mycena leptocephala]
MTTWLVVLSSCLQPPFLPVLCYPLPLIYKLLILIVLPPILTLSRPSRVFGRLDVVASGDRVSAVEDHMGQVHHVHCVPREENCFWLRFSTFWQVLSALGWSEVLREKRSTRSRMRLYGTTL